MFDEKVSDLLDRSNKLLAKLDNGGFEVVMVGNVTKISKSDISLADSYKDRLDGDKIKEVLPDDLHAQTFAFQEAVFNLPPALKKEVNLRILFMKGDKSAAFTEEQCICDQHHSGIQWGCVSIFSINYFYEFPASSTLFAYALGQALGNYDHAASSYPAPSSSAPSFPPHLLSHDRHYDFTRRKEFYMWSTVGFG